MIIRKLTYIFIILQIVLCSCVSKINKTNSDTQRAEVQSKQFLTPSIQIPTLSPISSTSTAHTITNTATATVTPQKTATPSPTRSPSPTIPPMSELIVPQVVKRCPEDREVPLKELGLNPKTRLVILNLTPDGNTDFNLGFWTISPNKEWKYIPYTMASGGMQNLDPRMSPNGNWLAYDYYRLNHDESYIMVTKIDGTEQRTFGPFTRKDGLGFQWLSNQVLISYARTTNEDLLPRIVIHPITGEMQLLPNREELYEKTTYITTYLSQEEEVYILYYSDHYQNPDPGFVLYNMNTGTSIPVLNWFEDEEWLPELHLAPVIPWNLWFDNNNTVNVVVYTEYGFDIATSMSLDFISQPKNYWEVMQPISMPVDTRDIVPLNWDITTKWGAKSKPYFVFSLDNISKRIVDSLYGFDYNQMILVDYCLDHVGYLTVSPDERFIAWNVYDNISFNIKEVVVLSLETGKMTKISTGAEILGWGEIP